MSRLAARCDVWWVDLSEYGDRLAGLLTAAEIARGSRFTKEADRRRFFLGAAMLRYCAGQWLGVDPIAVDVDRTCLRCGEPHGKPRLPGTGLYASVSHSRSMVGLALCAHGSVGLDIEYVSDVNFNLLIDSALAIGEERPQSHSEFFTYWTRKESVVKATGEGLSLPLTEVVVSSPADPPALLSYAGQTLSVAMFDLAPRADYASALAVLIDGPIHLTEHKSISPT